MREVFKTHYRAFVSRTILYVTRKFAYNCSNISFGEYGDSWKTLRKMAVQELLISKKVQSLEFSREVEVDIEDEIDLDVVEDEIDIVVRCYIS